MTPIDDPAMLAASIDLDLEQYRRMAAVRPFTPLVDDTAEILRHVSERLHDADDLNETVQLDRDVVHLIEAFRTALRIEARERVDPLK